MIQKKSFSIEIGGKTLTIETSQLAQQTNASVIAKYGETVVLATAVMSRRDATVDYLPLKVDYEERFYAAGKIIGSRYIRREGRPSEEAILTGRLVDRVIRPLFDDRLRREIQVVVTVLAYDEENDPDFVGLMAASTALASSDIPWAGPVGGVRIAKIGSNFIVNPGNSDIKKPECVFETFAAGPESRISMIELAGTEAKEEEILKAFALAQEEIKKIVEFEKRVVAEIGKPKIEALLYEPDVRLRAAVEKFLKDRLEEAMFHPDKEQHLRMHALETELVEQVKQEFVGEVHDPKAIHFLFEEIATRVVHECALEKNRRPDGRAMDEVRELNGDVRLFERPHGSAVFIRGNTQALAMTTLAPPGAEQMIETMEVTAKRRFILHYNFPPYSVGEVGMFRGPGRREIGHGALAEKSIRPSIPTDEFFPYTIRVVSEILSSNGSSSMATVCATTMSLMDAGVPIKKPVAGIAMGLMVDQKSKIKNQKFKVLTDLQGPEDHYGDMDFKVAGTEDGVNAIQLDVKCEGLTMEIITQTLADAKAARLHILKFMKTVIAEPRKELSPYVPTILRVMISPSKIGALIGPGGKMINGLIEKWELASIDVEEDGRVFVAARDPEKARQAAEEIKMLTREFKVGEILEGRVMRTMDFGAIVDLGGGKDGMIHVSELKEGFVKTVTEVVNVGDFVRVKVIRADDDGRIGLSMKQVEKE